jgi:galactoside O-acetyltransferase
MEQFLTRDELRDLGLSSCGDDVQLHRYFNLVTPSDVAIGSHVRIDGFGVATSGRLEIGSYIHIGSFAYLACRAGIRLGNFANLSQGVKIYTTSDDYSGASMTNPMVPDEYKDVQIAPVEIGEHTIIGAGSIVLPGTIVPEGVAIGALSLVRGTLEPWSIYAGVPARWVRARSRDLLKRGEELISKVSSEGRN